MILMIDLCSTQMKRTKDIPSSSPGMESPIDVIWVAPPVTSKVGVLTVSLELVSTEGADEGTGVDVFGAVAAPCS